MHRIIALACPLAFAAFAAPAAADSNVSRAARLFDEAQARTAAGDFAGACDLLAESQRLDPQLGTLLHRGHCLEKQGKTASAWVAFRAAAGLAAEKNARGDNEPREDVARRRAAKLEPSVSFLELQIDEPDHALALERDGQLLAREAWTVRTPIDPGLHTVVARAPDRKPWRHSFEVAHEGQTVRIRIPPLAPIEEASAPVPLAAPAGAPERSTPGQGQRIVGYALAGGGVVALGLGLAFGVASRATLGDRETLCPNAECRLPRATAEQVRSLTRRAEQQSEIANWAFVLGGALVAAGAVVYLTAPDASTEVALALDGGPGLSLRSQW